MWQGERKRGGVEGRVGDWTVGEEGGFKVYPV